MSQRFFSSSPIDDSRVTLTDAEAHHLLHVMRARVGDEVTLFDGSGVEFQAAVTQLRRSEVELQVRERREINRELPRRIVLGVPLPKGDRQRWLVEKAVEMGVAQIVPLVTVRSVSCPESSARDRLRRTVVEASKQCGRNRLLELAEPQRAGDFFRLQDTASLRLLAHVEPAAETASAAVEGCATSDSPIAAAAPDWPVCLAIGPEGGWADDEVLAARAAGWRSIGLGERILRLETAALALVARFALPF